MQSSKMSSCCVVHYSHLKKSLQLNESSHKILLENKASKKSYSEHFIQGQSAPDVQMHGVHQCYQIVTKLYQKCWTKKARDREKSASKRPWKPEERSYQISPPVNQENEREYMRRFAWFGTIYTI